MEYTLNEIAIVLDFRHSVFTCFEVPFTVVHSHLENPLVSSAVSLPELSGAIELIVLEVALIAIPLL